MYGDTVDDDTLAVLDLLDFDQVEDFDTDAPGEWLGIRLETTDITELNGHELVEFVAAVQRQRAHLDALALRATQELAHCPPGDVGSASVRSELPAGRAAGELELHCGWTPYKAGQYVSLAMDLGTDLAATLAALEAGDIEADTARVVCERTEAVKNPVNRRKIEANTLTYIRDGIAKGLRRTTSQVRDKVNREVLRVEPDAVKKRHAKRVEDRGVGVRADEDSTACLSIFNAPADQAAQAYAGVDMTAREIKRQGDERPLSQIRADVALSRLAGTGRSDARAGGRIMLVTTLSELAGMREGTSTLSWLGAIHSEVARRLTLNHLDNPRMEYDVVITDPHTGRVRQIHPLGRRFTGTLRTMIQIDSPWCEWPTCSRSSLDCEVDHLLEWANGGATEFGNGGPKCDRGHHREKSENGWTDTTVPERQLVSPHDHRYPVEREPLIPPEPPEEDPPPF